MVKLYLLVRWPIITLAFIALNIIPFFQLMLMMIYACGLPIASVAAVAIASELGYPEQLKMWFNRMAALIPLQAILYLFLIAGDRFQVHYLGWFKSLVERNFDGGLEFIGWSFFIGTTCMIFGLGALIHKYMKVRD